MTAELEKWMFGNPAEIIDGVIRQREVEARKAKKLREHKHRRIAMLVKLAKLGKLAEKGKR